VDFELLSSSLNTSTNPQMKEELEKLKKLADSVKDTGTDNVSKVFL
jgi:hypothetical protein